MPFSDHLGSHHQENCRPRDVHLILESCAVRTRGNEDRDHERTILSGT